MTSEAKSDRHLIQRILLVLLITVPVALAMKYVFGLHGTPIFIASAISIIPLAGYMGNATEELAEHLGAGWGGFLNATFGNAAELIIAIIALRWKASSSSPFT